MMAKRDSNNKQMEADLVVIGSGGGLAAAVAAAEAGVSVILLEKVGTAGGYTRQANILMACESPVQKRLNINLTTDEVFRKYMAWNHWHRVDPRVVRAYINKSGDTIRWLEEKGVEFELLPNDCGYPTTHMPKDMMASVQKTLIKNAKELGVSTLLNTSGKKILRDINGRVSGVLVVNKDGQEFKIQSKCVIIATGGFSDNRELLQKYCPDYYDGLRLDDWPYHEAHSGDGIFLAEEIGAAIADRVPIYHRGGGGELGGPPWRPVLPRLMYQRMLWVNKKGKRYADEATCATMEGNMSGGNALFLQPDREVYSLFGMELVQAVAAGGPGYEEPPRKHAKRGGGAVLVSRKFTEIPETIRELVAEGKIKTADSWEEIAGWIGCNPEILITEVDVYNSYCANGHDNMFSKDPDYLVPLREPPYYAIKGIGGEVGQTLGGIKVDENMAVLDRNSDVIPGVYAAGVIADGHQGQTYCYELGYFSVFF
jgi:fumarate reductase flavoprotein subunit